MGKQKKERIIKGQNLECFFFLQFSKQIKWRNKLAVDRPNKKNPDPTLRGTNL